MAVKKLSIALDVAVAEQAAAAAERDGLSLSAWINAAAEQALMIDRGLAAVREWEAEHGEPSPEAIAWAEGVVGGGGADRGA